MYKNQIKAHAIEQGRLAKLEKEKARALKKERIHRNLLTSPSEALRDHGWVGLLAYSGNPTPSRPFQKRQ